MAMNSYSFLDSDKKDPAYAYYKKNKWTFEEFLTQRLIPDLMESGSVETAKDFKRGLAILRNGWPNPRSFVNFLDKTLIPDLKRSGSVETAKDFALLSKMIKYRIINKSFVISNRGIRKNAENRFFGAKLKGGIRRPKKGRMMFNNSARSADMTVANELFLFIQNDEILLMRRYPQYVLNLKRKIKRGVYDREKAVKLFMYLADEASKKYSKQFGDGKTHTADVPTRMALAKMLRDKFESEHFERGIGQYMMTGVIDSMKIRKNSTHERGMVNPDLSTRERDQDSSPLKKLVMDLASDFAPVVKDIESSRYSTTQNNYGRYMSLISSMSKGDKKRAEIIAMALITAGANRSGVKSALRVMFGD
jgi:hypothetical protein